MIESSWVVARVQGLTEKCYKGDFWSDKNVIYHDCCGGYMAVHIWKMH